MIPMTSATTTMMTKTKMLLTAKQMYVSLDISRFWIILLFLIAVNPVISGYYTWGQPSRDTTRQDEDAITPEFEVGTSSISTLIGQPVYLPCRVRNLGDRVVSWIRTRDLHILTSGTLTYTSDLRFGVLHPEDSEMWTLRIMSAQSRDEGKYECQVNTDPKINFAVLLSVKESDMRDPTSEESSLPAPQDGPVTVKASANIMGPKEQYVHQGSTVTFTCIVMAPYSQGSRPPRIVDWFHSDRLVTIQAARGGISIDTEKSDFQTTSKLTVAGVTYRDAGNYTCRPADTQPAGVVLIVLEGEHTEAMQRDGHYSRGSRIFKTSFPYQLLLVFLHSLFHIIAIR